MGSSLMRRVNFCIDVISVLIGCGFGASEFGVSGVGFLHVGMSYDVRATQRS